MGEGAYIVRSWSRTPLLLAVGSSSITKFDSSCKTMAVQLVTWDTNLISASVVAPYSIWH